MISSSAMSAAIRAKKKKLKDNQEAVKLSGIPEDATDESVVKNHEPGEELSENDRSEPGESASISPSDESMHPDPMPNEEKDKKKAKIRSMLSRMGK